MNLGSALASASGDIMGPLAVAPYAAQEAGSAVEWTAIVGCDVDAPNTLRKTAATGWGNAGAVSDMAIAPGSDGHVQVEVNADSIARIGIVGLSNGDSAQQPADVDFGLYCRYNTLYVYESGADKTGIIAVLSVGDLLRVAVESGVIRYYRNDFTPGAHLYQSAGSPSFPLLVDAALYHSANVIFGATLSGTLEASGY